MTYHPISLKQKFSLFSDHWSPRVVAEMNDYQFKLVKISGEFVWHDHLETECQVMIIEPRGVVNTGDTVTNDLTAENDIWI